MSIYIYIYNNITAAWAVDREFVYIVVPARALFRNVRFACTKPLLCVKITVSRRRNPYFLGRQI